MAGFYREPDRKQKFLLPVDMADWVSRTDLVTVVLDVVYSMDQLLAFESRDRKGGGGAPRFSPRMMICPLLYAYATGYRSSRKIESMCKHDARFRMIVGNEIPDHSVIARFRKRHSKDMEEVLVAVLKLCHDLGIVQVGVVALDGTKVKANASLAANRTSKALQAEVEAMLAEAAKTDTAENEKFGEKRGGEIPADLDDPSRRLARIRSYHERLLREEDRLRAGQQSKIDARTAEEASSGKRKCGRKPRPAGDVVSKRAKEAKANVTDPYSRIMKSRKGYLQGYNAQAVVTADQIIVAADVTNQANDVRQLAPMMAQTRDRMEAVAGERVAPGVGLFDAGYWSDENAAMETDGEGGEYLIATTKDWKQRKALRNASPPRGRIPKAIAARERMGRKLLTKRGRALYSLRSQTVEPVFGQLKATQGADQFMMRGSEEARGEWNLHCVAHNLKKLHSESVHRRRKGSETPLLQGYG